MEEYDEYWHADYWEDDYDSYRQDAAIDAFYEKHPPRIERFQITPKRYFEIQFSLYEGIFVEFYEEIKDDPSSELCDDIVCTHDVKEAVRKTRAWLLKHEFWHFKIRKQIIEYIKVHWEYYKKSRTVERRSKNTIHPGNMKKLNVILEGLKNCSSLEEFKYRYEDKLHWFYWELEVLNELTSIARLFD